MPSLLGMFARHWASGRVKTRLASAIGNERAAEIHRIFVGTLLRRFSAVADQRVLLLAPFTAEVAGARAWQLWPQGTGDLGARMQEFFHQTLPSAQAVRSEERRVGKEGRRQGAVEHQR